MIINAQVLVIAEENTPAASNPVALREAGIDTTFGIRYKPVLVKNRPE